MATERFKHLPAEKQRCILKAAFDEFSRVPFDKASINKIVKEADISRGSFYTYFEDKWDLLHSVLDMQRIDTEKRAESLFRECGHNIWKVLRQLFCEMLTQCEERSGQDFIRNVFCHVSSSEMVRHFEVEIGEFGSIRNADLFHTCYMEKYYPGLDSVTSRGFLEIAAFSMLSGLKGIVQGYSREQILMGFDKKLEIMKYGIEPYRNRETETGEERTDEKG